MDNFYYFYSFCSTWNIAILGTMKKTITLTLNERESALLEALAEKFGHISTPTSLVHAAAEMGLLRIAASQGVSLKAWKTAELGAALDPVKAKTGSL